MKYVDCEKIAVENDLENDSESFRNPEPPKELKEDALINADNVGDTVFSKHWVFATLMSLIQVSLSSITINT